MKLIWTNPAIDELGKTIRYIANNYGNKSVAKFHRQLAKSIKMITNNPLSAPKELLLENEEEGFRSTVINRLNKLVYYIDNDTIIISDLWDTRKNPETLANRIKK